MDDRFSATLMAQNPWWRRAGTRGAEAFPLRRAEFESLRAALLEPEAPQVLLSGPRQVGKSVLLRQLADALLDQGWPPSLITLCDFEDRRFARPPTLGDVVDHATARETRPDSGLPRVFLFDEVHESPDWPLWLKQLHERRAGRFIVTDSAAALLTSGARESGGGRIHEHALRFLSFPDFLRFRAMGAPAGTEARTSEAQEFDAYLERGGAPAHVRTTRAPRAWERLRIDIVEIAIGKDLAQLAEIDDLALVQRLYTALAGESGAVFDATSRANDLGSTRQSHSKWVQLLVQTRLLDRLDRLERSLRKASRSQPKLYAADPGIASALAPSADPLGDSGFAGGIYETAIHRHLAEARDRSSGRLHFFRPSGPSGPEIDFVLEDATGRLAIEAKSSRSPNARAASHLAKVAGRLPAPVAGPSLQLVISRHTSRLRHDTATGPVLEVPAWEACRVLVQSSSVEEMQRWLNG